MSVNIKTADGKVSIASGSGAGGSGQTIQVVGLPTATAANLNSVYQYVGLSTDDYAFGHFYQCIEDEENPGTYKWATVYVQPTSTEEDMDLSNYVTKKELNNHVENGTLHCTAGEKISWNSKADGSYETKAIDVMNNSYTGTNKILVDSKYLYNQLKTTLTEYTTEDDFQKHSANNNSNEKHMTDAEQDIVSKLGVNSEGQLTYDDAAIASSGVTISASTNNILENVADGLYVPETDLSEYAKSAVLDDYEKIADLNTTLNDYVKTTTLVDYEKISDLNTTLSDYAKTEDVQDAIDHEHEHDNKTYLDLIGQDENGKMTYNGSVISGSVTAIDGSMLQWSDVGGKPFISLDSATLGVTDEGALKVIGGGGSASAAVDPDTTNILKLRSNGLYVPPTDLSAYEKTEDLNTTLEDYAKTEDVQEAIDDAHTHDNSTYLALIGQDANGKLTYNGNVVEGKTTTVDGSNIAWSDVDSKPFISIDPATLAVTDEGALKVIGGGGSGGSGAVSAQAGNSIVLKADGVYYKEQDLTPYAKTEDLTEYAKKTDTFNPSNKEVVSALGKNDAGQLTLDGTVVANASVTLDPKTDNVLVDNGDGLYVAPVSLDDYAKTADVSSTYLTQTDASSTYATQTSVADAIANEHTHSNKTDVLDKLSTNESGDLLFNGAAINADASGIAAHIADTDIHTTAAEKTAWNAKYDLPTGGIPSTDLASAVTTDINSRMKTSDWVNTTKNKIFGNKIDATTISHTQLKDIGQYSHDELEVLLENHISNTSLHNSASLNTITISNTGWSDGTMNHCHLNDDNDLCLDTVVGSDGKEYYYTTEAAKFVSMVYNSGIDDNSWVNINWFGTYSIYHTDVVVKVRVGSTSVPDEENWTEWTDVTLTKSLSGMLGRYIQVELIFTTDDDKRDVVFKNIQMSYGVDVFDEVSASRERASDGVTYGTLKLRLDKMDEDAKAATDEVVAARTKGDAETGTTYDSLDARLEDIDTSISDAEDRLDDLEADIPAADIQAAIEATINEWAADFAPTTTT